jgi:hypothetical protein
MTNALKSMYAQTTINKMLKYTHVYKRWTQIYLEGI